MTPSFVPVGEGMHISVITPAQDSQFSGQITLVMKMVGIRVSVTGRMIVVTGIPNRFK